MFSITAIEGYEESFATLLIAVLVETRNLYTIYMDEITILDKTYISSKRAAEITGYAKDYVGQLCREGHVDAKMVGRSWYVFEPSIRKHRFGEEAVVEEVAQSESEIQEDSASVEAETPVWEPSVYKSEAVDMIPELETVAQTSQSISEDTHATLTDMQSAWREWFDRKQEARIEAPEPELSLPSAYDDTELLIEAPKAFEYEAGEALEAVNEDEFSIPIHKMQTAEEDSFREEEENDDYQAPETTPDSDYESEYVVPIQRIAQAPVQAVRSEAYVAPERPMGTIRKEKIIKRKTKRTKAGKRGARTNAPIIAGLVAVAMISLAIAAVGTGYVERYLSGHVVNNPVVNFLVGDTEFKR
ncbi:MAG: hypothetical protein JWN49_375 [Parcubacteria group bacterium]|nr:hypothetical protein [Parcubacteria group bacterium]